MSPDGRTLAWSQFNRVDSSNVIVTRQLDQTESRVMPGIGGEPLTTAAMDGDSRSLVTLSDGTLSLYDVASGAKRVLYQPSAEDRGGPAAFGLDVTADAVLVGLRSGIQKVPIAGGPAQTFAMPDPARHSIYGHPRVLPDGRVAFAARRRNDQNGDVLVANADGTLAGRLDLPPTTVTIEIDRDAVIYSESGKLAAQRVDWSTLKPVGPPATIAADAHVAGGVGAAAMSISGNGVMAFRMSELAKSQFEWVDRSGRLLGTVGPVHTFTNFDVSPDASFIAATVRGQVGNRLWMIDVARNAAVDSGTEGLTSDRHGHPTGNSWRFDSATRWSIRPPFGGGDKVIRKFPGYPDNFSRDGRYVAVGRGNGPQYEQWAVRIDGSEKDDVPIVTGVTTSDEARFSPDGNG